MRKNAENKELVFSIMGSKDGVDIDFFESYPGGKWLGYWDIYNIVQEHGCDFYDYEAAV